MKGSKVKGIEFTVDRIPKGLYINSVLEKVDQSFAFPDGDRNMPSKHLWYKRKIFGKRISLIHSQGIDSSIGCQMWTLWGVCVPAEQKA